MRLHVYVVPPDTMPVDLETAAVPAPDGLEVYVSELMPAQQRDACVDAAAGAYLRRRAALFA
jgi:hypothetical protein